MNTFIGSNVTHSHVAVVIVVAAVSVNRPIQGQKVFRSQQLQKPNLNGNDRAATKSQGIF